MTSANKQNSKEKSEVTHPILDEPLMDEFFSLLAGIATRLTTSKIKTNNESDSSSVEANP